MRTKLLRPRSLLLLAALCLAACKDLPRDPVVACGADGSCPLGMVCTSDDTCWTPPVLPPQQLDAPGGLVAEVTDSSVQLSWVPVKDAENYRVGLPTAPALTVYTTSTAYEWVLPADILYTQSFRFTVQALATQGRVNSSVTAVSVSVPPRLAPITASASAGYDGVTVQWAPAASYKTYLVERATDAAGPWTKLACTPCQYAFDSSGGASVVDDSTSDAPVYWYRVTVSTSGLSRVSNLVLAPAPPPPPATPVLRAHGAGLGVLFDWDASAGADSYELASTVCQTTSYYQSTVFLKTSQTTASAALPAGTSCGFTVTAFRGKRHGPASAEVTAAVVPGQPAPPTASYALAGLAVQLPAAPPFGCPCTVSVVRSNMTNYAEVEVASGLAPGAVYLDTAPSPGVYYGYAARLVNAAGPGTAGYPSRYLRALGAPDVANLGPLRDLAEVVPSGFAASQTFTVGRDGVLSAIEVASAGGPVNVAVYEGDTLLQSTTAEGLGDGTIKPDQVGTSLAPLFLQRVTAGQRLRFAVSGPSTPIAVGVTADLYTGGALSGEPGADLAFRTFLLPADQSQVQPPGTPVLVMGNGAVSLTWQPSWGAVSYSVLRGNPYNPVELAAVTGTQYVDRGVASGSYFYSIRASYPSGAGATGGTATANVFPRPVALGGAAAPTGAIGVNRAGQSITIDRTATLTGIEVGFGCDCSFGTSPNSSVVVNATLTDGGGAVLRTSSVGAFVPPSGAPPALDPDFQRGSVLYVQPLPVTQGAVVRLDLSGPSLLTVGEGPSATGGELAGGAAVPGRALQYKLLYQ